MSFNVAKDGFVVILVFVSVCLPAATQAKCSGSWTGSPGGTLSDTDPHLRVSVTNGYFWYPSWAELKCESSCHLPDHPSYIWYKNGQKIREGTPDYADYFDRGDSISCAVRGREAFPSPLVCVLDETCNRVMYTHRSICAIKGSSAEISCTYNSHDYILDKFWFNPERSDRWWYHSQHAARVQVLEPERGRSTLRMRDLRESDSDQYHFKFTSVSFVWRSSLPGTTLTVTALQVQVIRIRVYQSQTYAELKCLSSCSPAARLSYVWFKNGKKVMKEDTSSYTDTFYTENNISCSLKGHEDYRSPSLYPSKLPAASVSPSGKIVEGTSVTLTCRANPNSTAKNAWYKENQTLSLGSAGIHHFTSISSEDRGFYHCKSEDQHFKSLFIDVQYAPKLPSVSVSPSGEIVEGSSVTLTCSSDANPAASYTWHKKNVNFKPLSKEPQLVLISIQSSDSGEYYCTAENKLRRTTSKLISIDVKYAPKLPSVSVRPSGEIVEGSSVNLTCSSDANPAANYTWFKENEKMFQGQRGIYHLTSMSSEDRGHYHCKSENQYGQTNSPTVLLDVQYAPKLPSVSVSPSGEIVEGSSVNLTCSSDANPAANYTWYKKNQTLTQGPEAIYHLTPISLADSGNYHCKSENEYGCINSTSVHIDVLYPPKLPSVSVSPSGEIVEGSSVNLTCSSDANPAASYTWFKENEDSPKASGQNFTITDFRAEHSGNYYCEAQNKRGRSIFTLYLTVAAAFPLWNSTMIINITKLTLVVPILISLLLLCLWMRK